MSSLSPPQPANKPSLDAAARAYTTLFNKYKDALFVAAAGASIIHSSHDNSKSSGPLRLTLQP